jgi:hypothetical protein
LRRKVRALFPDGDDTDSSRRLRDDTDSSRSLREIERELSSQGDSAT